MAGLPIALGVSSFRKLRERGAYFVDKSAVISEVIDTPTEVVLLPRPRRFGKTLLLSMCQEFFAHGGAGAGLFEGLAIRSSPHWPSHQGRHPVVFLTFKDLKADSWEGCRWGLRDTLQECLRQQRPLIDRAGLDQTDRALFESLVDGSATDEAYARVPRKLSGWLERATGAKVVWLIDEYDTPIHAAWTRDYYEPLVSFLRTFFSSALKDNPHLLKGLVTGILRVAKESIFSGLNNLTVESILRPRLSTACGFTEAETEALLEAAGCPERIDEVRRWYNGYDFAGTTIYNPWSLLHFVYDLPAPAGLHWANTSSNDLIEQLVLPRDAAPRAELDELITGGTVRCRLDDAVALRDLAYGDDRLWSLLFFSGYLTIAEPLGGREYALRVPNHEVREIFSTMLSRWLEPHIQGVHLTRFIRALQEGDVMMVERMLHELLDQALSYHDTVGEGLWHALFLGFFVWMEPYFQVRSNRESGLGRYDMALTPKQLPGPGYVIEFKQANAKYGETIDAMLDHAFAQIERQRYAEALRADGCTQVVALAIAFQGKNWKLRWREEPPAA